MSQVTVISITCTPHFKHDAENAWVTREGQGSIHYWFNPDKIKTLLEMAESIEAWSLNDFQQQAGQVAMPCPCCKPPSVDYSLTINSMEIRGRTYDRQAMASCEVSSTIHNEEPFNISVRSSTRVAVCTIL